ncbi:MAG: SOS response-associated peptidase [Pseudomonadota bacterium]|nr:SOS response-associated peptidase [Pseudomonadota bacterium]
MCSRYELIATDQELRVRFDAKTNVDLDTNLIVFPTNHVPVIKTKGHLERARWGLTNNWGGKLNINARAETLDSKKMFIPLLEHRCLVPASGYFEWKKINKKNVKYRISAGDGNILALAGLFYNKDFTLITCAPSDTISQLHPRMPAILDRSNESDWINPNLSFEQVTHLLKPYQGVGLRIQKTMDLPEQTELFDNF